MNCQTYCFTLDYISYFTLFIETRFWKYVLYYSHMRCLNCQKLVNSDSCLVKPENGDILCLTLFFGQA